MLLPCDNFPLKKMVSYEKMVLVLNGDVWFFSVFLSAFFFGSQKGPVTTTAEFVSYLAPFPKNAKVSKVSKKERKE